MTAEVSFNNNDKCSNLFSTDFMELRQVTLQQQHLTIVCVHAVLHCRSYVKEGATELSLLPLSRTYVVGGILVSSTSKQSVYDLFAAELVSPE